MAMLGNSFFGAKIMADLKYKGGKIGSAALQTLGQEILIGLHKYTDDELVKADNNTFKDPRQVKHLHEIKKSMQQFDQMYKQEAPQILQQIKVLDLKAENNRLRPKPKLKSKNK